jgi:F-type H+-transporting ATPase subunit delta
MSRLSTAKRYAQAAFELALEQDELPKWQSDLQRLAGLVANNDFLAYLEAPAVPETAKLEALRKLLPDALALVHNLAGVLIGLDLISLLPLISKVFDRLVDQQQGIERAIVTTAIPIEPEVVELIRRRLQDITGTKVIVTTRVSPAIIGGFVARVGDRLIDGSTRSRLKQLQGSMVSDQTMRF